MNENQTTWLDHLKFIIPSLIGIFLFMTPIKVGDGYTIPVGLLANKLENMIGQYLSLIMVIILLLTALFTLIAFMRGPNTFKTTPFFHKLFNVNLFWTLTRVVAAVFAVMVYFEIGPEAIIGETTGQELLHGLLHSLFTVFLFAGLFLPLLMNYGLMELFGTFMTVIMRPLFKLPGRSSVDSLASWIGDGTIGVLLTSKQYEDGFYTKREAAIIGTTFSVVSITFTLVVIEEIGLSDMFFPFYLTVLLAGFVAALIMPRIPPLSRKEATYVDGSSEPITEKVPEGQNILGFGYNKAIERAKEETNVKAFFKQGSENVLDMWMSVISVVMAFGTIALIIAEYTPFFQWVGLPFVPLLEWMQIPEAAQAAETILIGFADMFLPAIIGSSIEAEITRFVIAALSVTQLIYMSEVGGLLLGSKIPVNMKDLIVIFLLRTIITLPIIVLVAHFIYA